MIGKGRVERARTRRRLDCPFVFHLEGKPIGDFRKAWKKACQATGLSELIVHDLRRTAIRNMIRSGVSEVVAMRLSGHKTRNIFDRYDVVNEADLVQATEKLQTHLRKSSTTAAVRRLKKAS